jgi:hypothetical protein
MSPPASADPRASTDRANQPTLLGIPAELRNTIYDNVFSSETKHGLVPHALTRVSQCIRRESLAMYYASIRSNTLEILLHNPTQFAHAKQWLAEVDTNLYPVLPDIEFSWTEYITFGSQERTVLCARQVTNLDKELGKQIEWCNKNGFPSSLIFGMAMELTYQHCLGFSEFPIWIETVPSDFEEAVCEDKTWTVRHISIPPDCGSNPRLPVFRELAERKNGSDWEICDLTYIIESLENVAGKPIDCIKFRGNNP